ncbi:unnamed protein product [Miscanthus lutarioriparius]|uniref:Uncharacterized protein n=1 Tax=Miscanthus lutarioriparius TaxID=422564 RepID=A0A811Q5U5_9POAL|nr:unnamed protein product [Miscanthus lutarioriparius]
MYEPTVKIYILWLWHFVEHITLAIKNRRGSISGLLTVIGVVKTKSMAPHSTWRGIEDRWSGSSCLLNGQHVDGNKNRQRPEIISSLKSPTMAGCDLIVRAMQGQHHTTSVLCFRSIIAVLCFCSIIVARYARGMASREELGSPMAVVWS